MYKKNDHSGFTIIELVVVSCIIAILAGVMAPNFGAWQKNMSLKSASRDLYATLQEARLLAIRNNTPAAIVFDTANSRYYLCDSSGADGNWTGTNDATGTGDNNIVKTVDLTSYNQAARYAAAANICATASAEAAALPADGISYAGNAVVLTSQGTATIDGFVYLEDEDSELAYAVGNQMSGLVRLVKWSGGGWQ